MTFTVSVSASTTKLSVPVATPAAGDYQCRLVDSTGAEVQKLTNAEPSFQFKGVAANSSFTAEMSRLDVNGSVITGSVISAGFATPTDATPTPATVDIDIPTGITVSLAQE